MIRVFSLLAAFLLIACEPEEDNTDQPLIGASAIEAQRTVCENAGGRFGQGGLAGTLVCYTTPADAGDACASSSDCSGECLARSRTCAPVTPLFGCNDILDSAGRLVTLCRD